MDIRVSGHQIDTGEALQAHATGRLSAMAEKYLSRAVAATVTFGKGPYGDFTCDIVAPVAHGGVLKGTQRAVDPHVAFEGAADKVEKQLRRYASRLRERRNGAASDVSGEVPAANAGYTVFAAPQDAEEAPPESPAIIAETRVDIPEASVGDAAMMLDLRNTTALMFKNAKTGVLNMIYRRDDGTIGWVEPAAG